MSSMLPVLPVRKIDPPSSEERWLVEGLWGKAAVGIIGGAPKCWKTWVGLDIAVSVASRTPALGAFHVDDPGRALIYLAEDALGVVRLRLEALCQHRGLDIEGLDVHAITAPLLRLDQKIDQDRLKTTLERIKPRLLLLDPLVRLHRLDENSASDISGLLGFFREIQRTHDVAVLLVHHASKKKRSHPGQALRGSSDFHAFGDSNLYLTRKQDRVSLAIEHRTAQAPGPFKLKLVSDSDGDSTHLEIHDEHAAEERQTPQDALSEKILDALGRQDGPMTRTNLRAALGVKNERLGLELLRLETLKKIERTPLGVILASPTS